MYYEHVHHRTIVDIYIYIYSVKGGFRLVGWKGKI